MKISGSEPEPPRRMVTLVANAPGQRHALAEVMLDVARAAVGKIQANPPLLSLRWRRHGVLTVEDVAAWFGAQFGKHKDEESFARGQRIFRRARDTGAPVDDPFALPAPPLCSCKHAHCAGACLTWTPFPASCGRLCAVDTPSAFTAPCRPSSQPCMAGPDGGPCVHLHCETCGIGMPVPHPYVWFAHVSVVMDTRTVVRHEWGWRCRDCTPLAARDPEPTPEEIAANAERDAVRPRGCPRCGCDVEADGDGFRCAGLTATADAEREAYRVYEHRAFDQAAAEQGERDDPERLPWVQIKKPTRDDLAALAAKVVGNARAACGWRGSADDRGVLIWRERRTQRARGRPRKSRSA